MSDDRLYKADERRIFHAHYVGLTPQAHPSEAAQSDERTQASGQSRKTHPQ
jgi:hypothetical protein